MFKHFTHVAIEVTRFALLKNSRISLPRLLRECTALPLMILCFSVPSLPVCGAASPVFEKDIRPILKAHCFDCHGEGEKLKGGLDLRLRRLMLKGGDEGPVIVPGKPAQSPPFKLIDSGEMPKREKKLTRDEVALIK